MLCTLQNKTTALVPLLFPFHGLLQPRGAHTEEVSIADIESFRGSAFRAGLGIQYDMTTAVNPAFSAAAQVGNNVGQPEQKGVVPSARLLMATNPTDTDTVTIAGHVFKFMAALAAANTFTQVKILGTNLLTLAAFIDAVNGKTNANVVPATVPFAPAIPVVGDLIDTNHLRVRTATALGGPAVALAKGSASVTVSETLTAAADVWDRANLNSSGRAPAIVAETQGSMIITAQMIAATKVYIDLPFTPTEVTWLVTLSTGAQRAISDLVVIEGNAIEISLAGGASPNIQANDIFNFWAAA
jgi:hypothetical protein